MKISVSGAPGDLRCTGARVFPQIRERFKTVFKEPRHRVLGSQEPIGRKFHITKGFRAAKRHREAATSGGNISGNQKRKTRVSQERKTHHGAARGTGTQAPCFDLIALHQRPINFAAPHGIQPDSPLRIFIRYHPRLRSITLNSVPGGSFCGRGSKAAQFPLRAVVWLTITPSVCG